MEMPNSPASTNVEQAPLGVTETTVVNILTRTTRMLQASDVACLVDRIAVARSVVHCAAWDVTCSTAATFSRTVLGAVFWKSARTPPTRTWRTPIAKRVGGQARQDLFDFHVEHTDPFVPQEAQFGISRSVFAAMYEQPPAELIVQTHSHRVADDVELLHALSSRCNLRVHVSIESDRDSLPGLPPPPSSVQKRFDACGKLRAAGIRTVVTVSPLLPIAEPERFFARIAEVADGAVIDHFIHGDGSADGGRTLRTPLPEAMRAVCPNNSLEYRDRMVAVAREMMPHRVGVSIDGFAGRYL